MSVKGIRKEILDLQPYVPGKTIEEVQDEKGLDHVVKLGSNENPYGPFGASLDAMQEELVHLNRYPDIRFERIKKLLADCYDLGPENVALSHGAEGMLQTMGKCFIEPGCEVLIPGATYNLYVEITRLMGGTLVTVPLDDDFRIDLKALQARISPATRLVWLCNPNNPTGTVFDPDQLEDFLKALPETAWVILDEAYAEFASPEELPDRTRLIREGYNLIAIRTFSKAWGLAGVRMGYALARPEMVTVIDTVSEPFNANRVALAGGEAALENAQDDFQRSLSRILKSRNWMSERLKGLGCRVITSKANFVFFETDLDADDLANRLLDRGVIVRPCGWWGFNRAIRVSVGTQEDCAFFVNALTEILKDRLSTEGEK